MERVTRVLIVIALVLAVQAKEWEADEIKPFEYVELNDFRQFLHQEGYTVALVCTQDDQDTAVCSRALQTWQEFIQSDPTNTDSIRFGLLDIREHSETPSKLIFPSEMQKHTQLPCFFTMYRAGRKLGLLRFEDQYVAQHLQVWTTAVRHEGLPVPESQEALAEAIAHCEKRLSTLVFYDTAPGISPMEQQIHEGTRFEEALATFVVRDSAMATAIGIPESAEAGTLWAFPCPGKEKAQPVPLENEMSDEELDKAIMHHALPGMARIHRLLQARGNSLYQLTLVVAMSEEEEAGFLGDTLRSLENVQIMWDAPEAIKGGFQRAGSTGTVWPAVIAVQPGGRTTVFNEADKLTPENLRAFMAQVREGTYPPFIRAEPVPTYEDDQPDKDGEFPILPLVKGNLDERVHQSQLPSVVLYYAQNAATQPKSRSAFDIMKRLGSYFSHHQKAVQLFTYNVQLNLPPPEVAGIPQFVLYIPTGEAETHSITEVYDGKFALRPVVQWADALLTEQKSARRVRHDEL